MANVCLSPHCNPEEHTLALRLLGNSVKWDRKPPKEPELRNLLDSFPRSPGNPENHFQMQPRADAACREELRSTQPSPAPPSALHSYQSFFFFFWKFTNFLPSQQSFMPRLPTAHLSLSIKCLENTRRGNNGQIPVCDLCLELAKHDV